MSEDMIKAMAEVITGLHVQDRRTLELITELIQSVSRIETRVSALESQVDDLAGLMVIARDEIKTLRQDEEGDRIQ